jgi:hypothetical protein
MRRKDDDIDGVFQHACTLLVHKRGVSVQPVRTHPLLFESKRVQMTPSASASSSFVAAWVSEARPASPNNLSIISLKADPHRDHVERYP